MRSVLDSWAVLTLLQDGVGAGAVQDAIDSDDAVMSWINLGEVDYILRRREGPGAADAVIDDIRNKVDVMLPDVSLIRTAARIKASVQMAYADSFAAATSHRVKAPVLTGDPELLTTPPDAALPSWTYIDLRDTE